MRQEEIQSLLAEQRSWFSSGKTLPPAERVRALERLRDAIRAREGEINDALKKDLGKSAFESYMCEVGMTLSELSYMIRHLKSFAKPRRAATPLAQFAARSYVKPVPYGSVLIMSPWNYPFMLAMEPLVDALAAGNTAVVKPSAYSPHTSAVIAELLAGCFDLGHAAAVTGGREENQCLLSAPFDYIFFTGSPTVGREVLRRAAERLTPVTLELGGKSPCLVTRSANLPLTARRIVFGKFLNCGQTCVAPDYLYCDAAVKDALVAEIQKQIRLQLGDRPLENGDYGRIINQKHFHRICGLMDPAKVVWGGERDEAACRIAPTVMDGVGWDDGVMTEEIFGPVLQVVTLYTVEEAVEQVNRRPHPLALYLFTRSREEARYVTDRCQFGGGCVNDTIIHLATSKMGFGGVGNSGMGAYHGRTGFDTFSHHKSIVDKKNWIDLPMRYQPYRPAHGKLIRKFLK